MTEVKRIIRKDRRRLNYWPKSYSDKAIAFSLLLAVGFSAMYPQYFMPPLLFVTGISTLFLFFYGINHYTIRWRNLDQRSFEHRLWLNSMLFRLIFVGLAYMISFFLDPGSFPFELNAADSWTYHGNATVLMQYDFSEYFTVLKELIKSTADYGTPIYTSIIYKIFGPVTFPVRFVNCMLGSYTVVMLSRMARWMFSADHARLTGIVAMLMPSLLYFNSLQLKETLMIFLVIMVLYHAVKLTASNKIDIRAVLIMILCSFLLFYFRTFLAVIVIFSVLVYFGLNALKRKRVTVLVTLLLFTIGTNIFLTYYGFEEQAKTNYNERTDFFSRNITDKLGRVRLNVETGLLFPLYTSGAVLSPFPSILVMEERNVGTVSHFQNEIVRNLLYFFIFLGLYLTIRFDFRRTSLLTIFVLSYLYVITVTGTSLIDRFQLPALPVLLILFSVGYLDSDLKWHKRWNAYIVLIFIVDVGWNLFKLHVRGL